MINSPQDVKESLGSTFGGKKVGWWFAIQKELPSKNMSEAIKIFFQLLESKEVEYDGNFWKFKK